LIAVPPVEQALEFLSHEGAPLETLPAHRRVIAGNPAAVRAALGDLARDYHADEVFVVNILYSHASRLRSYELLADAFR
jgi:alkanesulfonate monooxygenase SsuD/methylene tetrahydromethanopterin reductase-like flavin-dependent oxidoreductase (luciferase family)